ncbi:MAG: sigma 54-interacting transcriptional regulator [Bdellovibrionales bacterium]|nr:sigma 54-interacting transcriptional regulator [Bdellovibrionales bacterium]
MINWEELRHIHVIRKLDGILSSWFNTAILITDAHGTITNHPKGDKSGAKNLLCSLFLKSGPGHEHLENWASRVCGKVASSSKPFELVDGPLPYTKAIVANVRIDNEFLGAVFAWPFLPDELTTADKQSLKKAAIEQGFNANDVEKAVEMLKAVDGPNLYYMQELVQLVGQEIETFHSEISAREERINALNSELGVRYRYDNIIGKAKPMQTLYSLLDKIKNSESTVMVSGENGTGKEMIASAIHYNSPRKEKVMLKINCAAFNENLLDSELFGHVKGAFTGAVKDKKGLFEAAHGGTLFLDEIGDMSPTMQVKLLRVLQEGTILPVGATEGKKVDVRVITATNKDLKSMVESGTFREDLYYRVNVINVHVPSMRERKEDIPLLVEAFLDKGCKEKGMATKRLAKRAMEKVFDYAWPGNVRELQNEVERLIVLSGDEQMINADLLSPRIKDFGETAKVQGVRVAGKLKDALEELEKTMIKDGLKRCNWNKSRLAKELGISRAGLIMKVEKYGLDKRRIAAAAAGGRTPMDDIDDDFDATGTE